MNPYKTRILDLDEIKTEEEIQEIKEETAKEKARKEDKKKI